MRFSDVYGKKEKTFHLYLFTCIGLPRKRKFESEEKVNRV